MIRYIMRRLLQMIPTVLGVVLVTFVLFNVVGGSPAAMTLGRHVTPKMLEDFDEVRGFNKPLILGKWAHTRALDRTDFARSPRPFLPGSAVTWTNGSIVLQGNQTVDIPLAFPLNPNTVYRLTMEGMAHERPVKIALSGENTDPIVFPAAKRVRRTIPLRVSAKSPGPYIRLDVDPGALCLHKLELARGVEHPFDSQFVFFLRQIARLDFGMSSSMNRPVVDLLKEGIVPSLTLTIPIFFVGLATALVLALLCAFFRDTWMDRLFVVLSVALMSVNYLVWIIVGQYVFAYRWGWFPVWGYESWRFLLLPVVVGVMSGLGADVRFYRAIMLDEMYKEYVRTAFAKGVSRSGVLFKHVLKNAMIPVATSVVISLPFLYTGSLLLESFFGIPGLGYISVNAVNSSDVDVVRAIVLIGSVLFVVANLLTDICYALLDPRVKLG